MWNSHAQSLLLDHYGILARLLFNEKPALGREVDEGVFRLLGFVHLYSASGIHIYALLRLIERAAARLAEGMGVARYAPVVKKIQQALGLLFLVLVWSVQSFRLGFARPILIFLIRIYARETGLKWQVFYPLVLTFLIDGLIAVTAQSRQPFGPAALSFREILFDGGRLHYYLAVGGALWCLNAFPLKSAWLEHLLMAVGSWIWIAPFDLWQHHVISWMTPILSLVTLPAISLILYPLSLGSFLFTGSVAPWIANLWNLSVDWILKLDDLGFTFSFFSARILHASALLALLLFLIWTFIFQRLRLRQALALQAAFVSLCFCFLFAIRLSGLGAFNNDQVSQLDVKQGDSALVIKSGRIEMIDVGSGRSYGPSDWIEKLTSHGASRIDTVLLSHLDEDHVGALKELLPWVQINAVQTHSEHWQSEKGQRLSQTLNENFPQVKRLSDRDEGFRSGKMVWLKSTSSHADGNDLMVGVAIPLSATEIYLAAGDSDCSQEQSFLSQNWREIIPYAKRIWKVSHHGSRFSSDPETLKWLHPTRSWISVGAHNTYHHPNLLTLATLESLRLSFERTDQRGDLTEYTNQSFF